MNKRQRKKQTKKRVDFAVRRWHWENAQLVAYYKREMALWRRLFPEKP